MNKFINQICDGCGQPLGENDDIVVCPECATPQHRECYNKNNCCVNEEKHSEDFVWKAQETVKITQDNKPEVLNDKTPCPDCGFENKSDSPFCHRCGQVFKELNKPTEDDQPKKNGLFSELLSLDDEELLEEKDRAHIEHVLEERSRIAAPGMTPEQEQEIVAGHPIKKVMTLVANKALVYVNKFRSIEHGKKLTWNWAAFLFSPYWFFYRRMYKTGIIFLTIRMCINLLLTGPMTNIANAYSSLTAESLDTMTQEAYSAFIQQLMPNMIPMYIALAVLLVLSIISGIIGDRFYRRKVKSILDEVEKSKSRDEYLIRFLKGSAVNPLAVAIAYIASTAIPSIISSFFM